MYVYNVLSQMLNTLHTLISLCYEPFCQVKVGFATSAGRNNKFQDKQFANGVTYNLVYMIIT